MVPRRGRPTVVPMHRSRIGLVLIDHPESDWERGLAFWAGVTGVTPSGEGVYRSIGPIGGIGLESQRIGQGTPARIHLDIESDDVPAEVARVVGLGATLLEDQGDFAILRDPGGLVFCVVGVQTGEDFERHALSWD